MKDAKIPVSRGPEEPSTQEIDAEAADETTGSQGQPREGFIRRTWGWITGKHTHIRDWLIAVFTLALTIATIFYVHYAGQQRDAMIDAVKESKRASDSAERAVEIAEQTRRDSERAAKETTDRAERATKATEDAARSMASQADTSKVQASASQVAASAADKSASIAQIGLLPRIEAKFVIVTLEKNKKLEMRVELTNKGSTTALNFIAQGRFLIPQVEHKPLIQGAPSVSSLGPEMSTGTIIKSSWEISPEVIGAIKDEKVGFRLWSWGSLGQTGSF